MVRLEPKPSFFAASCWRVLVLNGASGRLRRSRCLRSVTSKVFRCATSATIACAAAALPISGLAPSMWWSFAAKVCP